jgi:hypothetical protein
MTIPLVTPEEIAAAPELAVLAILAHAADVARCALFASYPELLSGDSLVEAADVTPQQCLAVALITSLDALLDSLGHYRGHLQSLAPRSRSPDPEGDDRSF